jgi:hypothetical protein
VSDNCGFLDAGRGASSLTRGRICNLFLQLLLGLARAVTLGSGSSRTHDHILLSHLRLPQPGGPGSRIYIPQEQSGPVIPLGTGFPSVASYDSEGYGGGILSRLQTESPRLSLSVIVCMYHYLVLTSCSASTIGFLKQRKC